VRRRRSKGFTLIELLVVIAIIAILAAMLFPVFARARESARKIQCLSNVKNIATAVQMYLVDYDAFPPRHTDQGAAQALNAAGPRGLCEEYPDAMFYYGNPFLRWQVILDEYVRNRDVWRCPSSQMVAVPGFIVPHYTPVWWQYLVDNSGDWGQGSPACNGGPCCVSWPSGWGGTVTDTIGQDERGSTETGATEISYGYPQIQGHKTSQITDPAWLIVIGCVQAGPEIESAWFSLYAGNPCCCWGLSEEDACRFVTEPSFRKRFAPHMGGANWGFADGHAAWWDSEAMLTAANGNRCCTCEIPLPEKIRGFCPHLDNL